MYFLMKPLAKKALANLRRTLEHLASKPKDYWERPHASPIGDNIYVIRFAEENRSQWRIYGEHDDDRECFVLCCHGTERDRRYHPTADVCRHTANTRMAECRQHWDVRTCQCLSGANGVPTPVTPVLSA